MCCASVKGIGLTSTLPISEGSEGQASHDYMVMGLSQKSQRDQFSAMDFCQGTMIGIIFKITLYVEVSKSSSVGEKNNLHTASASVHIHRHTQASDCHLIHYMKTSELTKALTSIQAHTFIFCLQLIPHFLSTGTGSNIYENRHQMK